jgi:hypothetical protein
MGAVVTISILLFGKRGFVGHIALRLVSLADRIRLSLFQLFFTLLD